MRKFIPSQAHLFVAPRSTRRQVIIVGAGHNGLVAAAYLAKAGLDVLVLERRPMIGGAAVTEELHPGFHYSRASYVAGLLRPRIVDELQLERHGFEYLPRETSGFTLCDPDGPHAGKYLRFCTDAAETQASIAQFSARDAERFDEYERMLSNIRELLPPIIDAPLPELGSLSGAADAVRLAARIWPHRQQLLPLYELMTSSAERVLSKYFESDVLKATLALDAVIGNSASVRAAGSGYALLHLVMGETLGRPGVWSYHKGGMGALSGSIRRAAEEYGAEIVTNAECLRILVDGGTGRSVGVEVHSAGEDSEPIILEAAAVISNATPHHTFTELLDGGGANLLPKAFLEDIWAADYGGGAMKINCAVDKLPNFTVWPNVSFGALAAPNGSGPPHQGTAHFEDSMGVLHAACEQAAAGFPAARPVIEMAVPSAIDVTLAPPGQHVVQFFVQYMPYHLHASLGGGGPGGGWESGALKEQCADVVFDVVERHCPGFKASVLHRDVLSPRDLEKIFGLHQGNIYHGGLGLSQIGLLRPAKGYASHRTPIPGLYLCGAGCHPGGGVMGAAGRNCSTIVLRDF